MSSSRVLAGYAFKYAGQAIIVPPGTMVHYEADAVELVSGTARYAKIRHNDGTVEIVEWDTLMMSVGGIGPVELLPLDDPSASQIESQ